MPSGFMGTHLSRRGEDVVPLRLAFGTFVGVTGRRHHGRLDEGGCGFVDVEDEQVGVGVTGVAEP